MRFVGSSLLAACLALPATSARAQTAAPPASASAPADGAPVEEPPYDPAQHDGWSESAWLRGTRLHVRRSTPMMITGIAVATLGGALVTAGAAVGASGSGCSGQMVTLPTGAQRTSCGAMAGPTIGAALGIAGLISMAIGIPLTIGGATGVPRQEAGQGPRSPRRAFAALEPAVLLGLRTASFALKF